MSYFDLLPADIQNKVFSYLPIFDDSNIKLWKTHIGIVNKQLNCYKRVNKTLDRLNINKQLTFNDYKPYLYRNITNYNELEFMYPYLKNNISNDFLFHSVYVPSFENIICGCDVCEDITESIKDTNNITLRDGECYICIFYFIDYIATSVFLEREFEIIIDPYNINNHKVLESYVKRYINKYNLQGEGCVRPLFDTYVYGENENNTITYNCIMFSLFMYLDAIVSGYMIDPNLEEVENLQNKNIYGFEVLHIDPVDYEEEDEEWDDDICKIYLLVNNHPYTQKQINMIRKI